MQFKITALLLFVSLCCGSGLDAPKGAATVQSPKSSTKSVEKEQSAVSNIGTTPATKPEVSSTSSPITIVTPNTHPTPPSPPTTKTPSTPTTPSTPPTPSTPTTPKTPATPSTPATSTSPPPTVPSTHPTPTAAPTTPKPAPHSTGDWSCHYASSSTCIRLVGDVSFKIGYAAKNATGEAEVVVPKDAVASGNCTLGVLSLSWPSNLTKQNDSVRFVFSHDVATKTWKLASIMGEIVVPVPSKTVQPNNTFLHIYTNETSALTAHDGMSYQCKKVSSYNLTPNQTKFGDFNITSSTLQISQLQVEAFKSDKPSNSAFGSANDCELTPDMVPIVVGCALAALVIIVLIAYVIAQRRPFAHGYRSV